MTNRPIFHLAFPVADLAAAKSFYLNILGAEIGRENNQWLDILVWGHQITLHHLPDEVLAADKLGKRHFGVVLPWAEWEQLAQNIEQRGGNFMKPPALLHVGTHEEQGKFYLEDPSFNVIEIKTYRSFTDTMQQQ